MIFTVSISSYLMGMIYRQRCNYLILVYFVLLYCFAEIWRLFIFNAGIIITLMVFSLATPFVSITIKWIISQSRILTSRKNLRIE